MGKFHVEKMIPEKFSYEKIISRVEWGAKPNAVGKPYFPHVPSKVIIHHYGFPEEKPNMHIMPLFKGHESIRELQKEDIRDLGLIDIKFHYIIAPDGVIYEGRPSQYIGKHTPGQDNGGIGILVYGNFNVEIPTQTIRESLVWLLLHLRYKHGMDLPKEVYGHRCKKLTTCPGHHLYAYIQKLKQGRV
jgi:hypothetical protein